MGQKTHKIAKKVIIKPKNQTGLAMVDIYTKNKALKIAWIRRLAGECGQDLFPILKMYLKYDIELILKCNISPQDCDQCWRPNAPIFWMEVLRQWCHYNYSDAQSVKYPQKEILWLNSNIKVGNQLYFIKKIVWQKHFISTWYIGPWFEDFKFCRIPKEISQ